jgi:hypothetical protein
MKRTRIALAAIAVGMGDIAFASARKSYDDEAIGHEQRLLGCLATNTTLTRTEGFADGTTHFAEAKVVYDATAIVAADRTGITLGFKPSHIVWWNATDRIRLEWFAGMADDSCLKTAANGTQTLEITSGNGGITVSDKGFTLLQNATLGAVAASKTCYFMARG